MNVLFLALGASRRPAVVAECAQVVADGGTACVLVGTVKPWLRAELDEQVELIDAADVWRGHLPMKIEYLVLYRGPRFLMYRVIGRGPLRRPVRRAARAYERHVADVLHQRVYLPVYLRLYAGVRDRLILERVRREKRFDWVVVGDPASMPDAVRLLDSLERAAYRPGVSYSIDHVPPARRAGTVIDDRELSRGIRR
jgi:hypothetical protein